MRDAGEDLRLAQQSALVFGGDLIVRPPGAHQLQGDQAAELRVLGQVHDSHAALAQDPADFVPADLCAWRKAGRGGAGGRRRAFGRRRRGWVGAQRVLPFQAHRRDGQRIG